MSAEHEMAVAIATEIGKQVPVKEAYGDVASPAAKQVGATLEDVIKCIRLVGFPIQWLAVQQDRFRDFIERAKNRVPEDMRILPSPQLLGPILEGIKYELTESPVVDMFNELLSRSMNKDELGDAHPAFPNIIKQLSPAEAMLISKLGKSSKGIYIHSFKELGSPNTTSKVDLAPTPEYEFMLEHIASLGLAEWFFGSETHKSEIGGFPTGRTDSIEYRLTFVGRAFARAVCPS